MLVKESVIFRLYLKLEIAPLMRSFAKSLKVIVLSVGDQLHWAERWSVVLIKR
jgi:hypothetical protein